MRSRCYLATLLVAVVGGSERSPGANLTERPVGAGKAAPLQRLLDATRPGETVRVATGTHAGNLRVTRPVRLVGEPGAIIQGDGTGHVVHILSPGVTVEALEIRGSGSDLSADHAGIMIEGDGAAVRDNTLRDVLHGVYVKGVSQVSIERNAIRGGTPGTVLPTEGDNAAFCSTGSDRRGNGIHLWNSRLNLIRGNSVSAVRDGIYLSFTSRSRIQDNHATSCRYGLHYMYSDGNEITGNTFTDNAAGAALMFSKDLTIRNNRVTDHRGQRAGGIVLHSVDYSRIEKNHIARNRTGLYLQNCNGNSFTGNRLVQNYIGFRLPGSSTGNLFQENSSADNLHNVDLAGRDNGNRWDDGTRGNFWRGSASPDLDGDGVGEWPHREADILGPCRQDFPLVALLSASPFAQTAQFAFQRAPVPEVPTIRDNRPLLREGNP